MPVLQVIATAASTGAARQDSAIVNIIAMTEDKDGKVKLIAIAALVGILTGTATSLLGDLIGWITGFLSRHMTAETANRCYLVLPAAGIFMAIVFQRYIAKINLSGGVPMINGCFQTQKYRLSPKYLFAPILGCTVTIGLGGSAGAEGPSACTGAAIGSNLARWFKLSDESVRILLACGAGAGIAGIFKAPVGGVLFTLEVLAVGMTTFPVLLLITSCLISYATAYIVAGMHFDIIFHQILPFDVRHMLWTCLLGVFCGVYSIWYRWSQEWVKKFMGNINNVWVRALLGGSVLSMAIFMFPSLYGEGYGMVSNFVSGRAWEFFSFSPFAVDSSNLALLLTGVAAVLLLKGGMVGCTLYSGGVAGDFAPTIFAGCMAGYFFGVTANHLFDASLSPENMALVGMAAVMSGVIRAPLMSIFIAVEMSNSFEFIAGFILASVISYAIVVFITPDVKRLDTQLDKRIDSALGRQPASGTGATESAPGEVH